MVDFPVEDLFRVEKKRPTQHVTTFVLSINTNDDYDEDDDEEEYYDFFEDYCAPDDDAILTLITRGDDHTAERYGRAIAAGVSRLAPGGVLRRGLGGCGNFGTFLYLFSLSLFLCFLEEMDDGQGEMRKSALQSREARASRVGGRHNRRSSRASFSRLSMDDDDDGFDKKSKFSA